MNTKIKSLVKSAVLGVAVLGGAMAMQSFTKKPANVYGYNYTTQQWIQEDNNHACIPNPDQVCKFEFDTAPSPGETPENTTARPLGDRGSYEEL